MGKLTEGKQSLPKEPIIATKFDGEAPNTGMKTGPKSKFSYSPKPTKQLGDSGRG
jgi:hypothetical protein